MRLHRILLGVALTQFLAPAMVRADAPKPLNVIFILADDLGWSDLACYGADLHETPHLDRLARQGVRFTRAYAASVCSPTRSSLMTGKHNARLGITTWHESAAEGPAKGRTLTPPPAVANLPLAEVTIAERLQAAGYLTALVGKWHLGTAGFYPEAQGFEVNVGGTFWGAPASFFWPYKGQQRFGGEYRYVPGLNPGKKGDYLTDALTDEALSVIDAAGDRPFLLYLAHHAPHTPIEAKPADVEHFRSKLKPGLNHRNPGFAAMVKSLDDSVGRVMAHLEKKGLADRTVVIFSSDNGGYISEYANLQVTSNAPLRSGKGSLYEGGIRVPLIVRWPGVAPEGTTCHEPVAAVDFTPTLLDILGQPPAKEPLDGLSYAPLLRSPNARLDRDALYFHYPHYYPSTTPVSAVLSRNLKYLHYYETDRGEFYDLTTDPGESRDLAPTRPADAARLKSQLDRWLDTVGAKKPTR